MSSKHFTRPERNLHFAKYFLSKTISCLKNENTEYEPNLNAFVLFSRAIGFSIEKQYSKSEKYKEWNNQQKQRNSSIFKPFTTLRNIIEKEGAVVPKMIKQNVHFGEEGITGKGGEAVDITIESNRCIVTKTLEGKIIYKKEFETDYDVVIDEPGKNSVVFDGFIEKSQRYLEVLENMINEAKSYFD